MSWPSSPIGTVSCAAYALSHRMGGPLERPDISWPSLPIGTVSCTAFVLCHRTGRPGGGGGGGEEGRKERRGGDRGKSYNHHTDGGEKRRIRKFSTKKVSPLFSGNFPDFFPEIVRIVFLYVSGGLFPTVSVVVVRFSSDSSFLLLLLPPPSSSLPVLRHSTNAVQLIVPIGDDGQRCPSLWPVLWLSTNAVQMTVPIGDDSQLMSGRLRPMARPIA